MGEILKQTFTTTIQQAEDSSATGIRVPPEIVAGFGKGKRPKVKVTINGYTYRSTVAAYGADTLGEVFMLPLAKEHRQAAGVGAGDEVQITLEVDEEPRTVEVPPDLAAALAERPGAMEAFEASSYTNRKEYVRQVEEAKAAETRQRRIEKIVSKLTGG